jgi:hypothetical protein
MPGRALDTPGFTANLTPPAVRELSVRELFLAMNSGRSCASRWVF